MIENEEEKGQEGREGFLLIPQRRGLSSPATIPEENMGFIGAELDLSEWSEIALVNLMRYIHK